MVSTLPKPEDTLEEAEEEEEEHEEEEETPAKPAAESPPQTNSQEEEEIPEGFPDPDQQREIIQGIDTECTCTYAVSKVCTFESDAHNCTLYLFW